MKAGQGILLLCAAVALAAQAGATVLPEACGDDKIKFEVTTQKDQPLPATPAAGKAQIVFIEDQNQMHNPFHPWGTVRFAMDGGWVGANKGNSYFTLDVAPGLHHLCVSLQGFRSVNIFDLAPINAEAGQVYYFAARVTESQYFDDFGLSQLNDDQGKYRLKVWKLSSWKLMPAQN